MIPPEIPLLWISDGIGYKADLLYSGLPGGSDGKESAFYAGDLGWEDPLEKGIATHSNILAWRFHGQRNLAGYIVHGVAKSQTRLNRNQHPASGITDF